MAAGAKNGGLGLGVDRAGGPTVDPSENVKALSEAANKRQDDLRLASERYVEAEIKAAAELAKLRVQCADEIAKLRSDHAKEMLAAETNRLNAIRQVDILAGNTASDRAQVAIQTLAATTAANAENIRNTLTTTAATIATSTANIVTTITERLAALERSSYEGKGKQLRDDPLVADLAAKMDSLMQSRAGGQGRQDQSGESRENVRGIIMGGFAFLSLVVITVGLVLGLTRKDVPTATVATRLEPPMMNQGK